MRRLGCVQFQGDVAMAGRQDNHRCILAWFLCILAAARRLDCRHAQAYPFVSLQVAQGLDLDETAPPEQSPHLVRLIVAMLQLAASPGSLQMGCGGSATMRTDRIQSIASGDSAWRGSKRGRRPADADPVREHKVGWRRSVRIAARPGVRTSLPARTRHSVYPASGVLRATDKASVLRSVAVIRHPGVPAR